MVVFGDLTCEGKRILLQKQLRELGDIRTQKKIGCLCGRIVPTQYMYRCLECGIFFCRKCAIKHFS